MHNDFVETDVFCCWGEMKKPFNLAKLISAPGKNIYNLQSQEFQKILVDPAIIYFNTCKMTIFYVSS